MAYVKKTATFITGLLLIPILISACGTTAPTADVTRAPVNSVSPSPSATPSPDPIPITLTPSYTPWPTPDTTRFPPTPDFIPTQTPFPVQLRTFTPSGGYAPIPDIYYFTGNTLFKKASGLDPVMVRVFPGLERVDNALLVNGQVAYINGQGVYLYDPGSRQETTLAEFDPKKTRYGYLHYDSTGNQLIYWMGVDDSDAEFSAGTIVGFYNLTRKIQHDLPQFHYSLAVLGFDAAHQNLYIQGFGQDADIGDLQSIDPEDGRLVGTIEFRGHAIEALSPDRKTLATILNYPSPDQTQNWWQIRLYDVSSSPAKYRAYLLPRQPAHPTYLAWSDDGRKLFFYLVKGDFGDVGADTASYGLWSLNFATGEMSQVEKLEGLSYAAYNLGWPWILIRFDWTVQDPMLINLETGQRAYGGIDQYGIMAGR